MAFSINVNALAFNIHYIIPHYPNKCKKIFKFSMNLLPVTVKNEKIRNTGKTLRPEYEDRFLIANHKNILTFYFDYNIIIKVIFVFLEENNG